MKFMLKSALLALALWGLVMPGRAQEAPSSPPVTVTKDNADSTGITINGQWLLGNTVAGFYGADALHDNNTDKGTKSVVFRPSLPSDGTYALYEQHNNYTGNATNVPVTIRTLQTSKFVTINQRVNGGQWNLVGTYNYHASDGNTVTVSTENTDGYVIADAFKWVKISSEFVYIKDNADAAGVTISGGWLTGNTVGGFYGPNALHDNNADKGTKSVTYYPALRSDGSYALYEQHNNYTGNATNVPVTIQSGNTTKTATINQRVNGGQWNLVGYYNFKENDSNGVTISTTSTDGYVIADAFEWVKISDDLVYGSYAGRLSRYDVPSGQTSAPYNITFTINNDNTVTGLLSPTNGTAPYTLTGSYNPSAANKVSWTASNGVYGYTTIYTSGSWGGSWRPFPGGDAQRYNQNWGADKQ